MLCMCTYCVLLNYFLGLPNIVSSSKDFNQVLVGFCMVGIVNGYLIAPIRESAVVLPM